MENTITSKTTKKNKTKDVDLAIKKQISSKNNIYRSIIHNAVEGFVLANSDFEVFDVNDALCLMTGFSRDELLSMKIQDIGIEITNKMISTQKLKASISNDDLFKFQQKLRCKNGSLIDGLVEVKRPDSSSNYYSYLIRDITEELKNLHNIKGLENKYSSLFYNIPVPTWENDYSRLKKYIDKLRAQGIEDFAKYFRINPEKLIYAQTLTRITNINQALMDFYEIENDNSDCDIKKGIDRILSDKNHLLALGKSVLMLVENKYKFKLETTITTLKGNIKKILLYYYIPPEYENTWANVIVSNIDITEQKTVVYSLNKSEKQYLSLFDNMPLILSDNDYSDVKLYIDELRTQGISDFYKYFDENPESMKHCIYLTKLNKVNNYTRFFVNMDNAYNIFDAWNKFAVIDDEYYLVRKECLCQLIYNDFKRKEYSYRLLNGNRIYVIKELIVSPDNIDTWKSIITVTIDVTELKNTEKQLNEYKKNLEKMVVKRTKQLHLEIDQHKQAEIELQKLYLREQELCQNLQKQMEQKIWFNRALVHELRTPLASMLGASDLMANNIKTEPWSKLAKNINQSACSLEKRVNEILTYTRGEMGTLKIQLVKVNPNELLRNVYELISEQLSSKAQNLTLEIPDHLPMIQADPEKIQEVLFNLIDNAFKYSSDDSITTISCKNTGDSLVFSVRDNGIGIPREKQALLFNPYCRIESQEGKSIAGLGLGLSICKSIVELHHGEIWVQSDEGTGSIFSFYLPIKIRNKKRNCS